MFGFLNIYKPKRMTSHDVVSVLRRVTKVKQIGHTGTLDPFAEGVLPICIGKATRLIEYLKDDKAYIGTVQLGKSTTTYDIEGEVVGVNNNFDLSVEDIEAQLNNFRGEIEQTPPIYSAIKVQGKKLYEYARNEQEVEIPKRRVTISKLDILNYDSETKQLELYIACSKGTYIRSIANDLGEKLGAYGHLIKLVRVKAGDFDIEKSVKLDSIQTPEDVSKKLIYPLEYLDYPKYELNEKEYEAVSHGNSFDTNVSDGIIVLIRDKKLVAIGECKNSMLKCKKVFI